ncbi:hypothetical protein HPB52_017293 [Rhipicephalus sanguineus]|uniref:Uncharacterized protein n=1 Tax=Rhipicephalus sanguineus TaxID=34632 RepID=A0A9D4Q247_RHISA|nr:hypothetical protein HPB52_017293 [Rhipicephalus sanguineus]
MVSLGFFHEQPRNALCHAPNLWKQGARRQQRWIDGPEHPRPMRGSIDRRATRPGSAGASSSQLLLLLPIAHTHTLSSTTVWLPTILDRKHRQRTPERK